VIETLAAIGSDANDVFEKLLLKAELRDRLATVVRRPVVCDALKQWLSHPSLTIWRAVAQILLAAEGTEGVNALRASLGERLEGLRLEDVSMLRQTNRGTRLLAAAAANAPLATKQRVAALCVEHNGRSLIPAGVYDIQIERMFRRVRITDRSSYQPGRKPCPERLPRGPRS
jgi:hypothetical protein